MKQNNSSTDLRKGNCDPAFCKICKAITKKKEGQESEGDPLQLYSKEAEHYFFYYPVSETDVKPGI